MRSLPVVVTEAAVTDLEQIETWIYSETASIKLVENYTGRIRERIEKLGFAPHAGVARPDLGPDIRMVPFEHTAVILYRVLEEAVEVLAISYGGRDYEAGFRNLN